MSNTDTDPGIFRHRDAFLARAVERLGTYPSDFLSTIAQIKDSRKSIAPRQAAGVLLPLLFRQSLSGDPSETHFVFQLIKRSSLVSQPGDLSCPGGMIRPFIDRILLPLLIHTPNPIIRGPARDYASHRETSLRRIMSLFLANALRESWEEIGLSPLRVRFLGLLNTSYEVEKVVEIPLVSFYDEKSIGRYILSTPDPTDHGIVQSLQHPCLIHHDSNGEEEILWGATFHICLQFLTIVMDYRLPDWEKGCAVHRALDSDYLTGKSITKRFFFS
jgi:8-oxo-dGTP pyrophosphatase MutT (NUDIX family)